MTNDNSLSQDTSLESKKKGRKPKKEKVYFGEKEELAVREFLTANSFEERNKIYNNILKKPIDKMISSIIRTYKLYRKDTEFDEIHNDTHSFLMTKIEKFQPSKEKKAYSYFGTICKNYLMGQILKDQKEVNRKISYEDISTDLENDENYSYSIDNESIQSEDIIKNFLKELNNLFNENSLNENELKLGQALYEIFENYDKIFVGTSNNKFNKNIILLSLREMTNLNTKEIRASLKKFKFIYVNMVEKMVR
jgi:predicted SprT family Zn-dependent metalloprotease